MTVLPETVPALLMARAAERGDHPLLICDDDVLSYEDAAARSAALAKGLLGVGAGKRTHVGVLQPNGSEFVIAWLAAARIGAVTIPLSTFSTINELGTLLRNADVELLLATPSFRRHDYAAALSDTDDTPVLRRVVFDTGELDGDGPLSAIERSVRPVDRLVIVHTSGSTSRAKGRHPSARPGHRARARVNELRSYTCDDVLFSNSPFFWIGGFAYSLLGTLLAGATLVCSNATERGSDARPARAHASDDGERLRGVGCASCQRSVVS